LCLVPIKQLFHRALIAICDRLDQLAVEKWIWNLFPAV
jgi:hypothetical protein